MSVCLGCNCLCVLASEENIEQKLSVLEMTPLSPERILGQAKTRTFKDLFTGFVAAGGLFVYDAAALPTVSCFLAAPWSSSYFTNKKTWWAKSWYTDKFLVITYSLENLVKTPMIPQSTSQTYLRLTLRENRKYITKRDSNNSYWFFSLFNCTWVKWFRRKLYIFLWPASLARFLAVRLLLFLRIGSAPSSTSHLTASMLP